MKLRLYHYWRSSCSWRVRFGFALKGVACEFVAVDLLEGTQTKQDHFERNPMGQVPVLEFLDGEEGHFLSDSLAILEWLEESHGGHALLPGDALNRARIRRLAQIIVSGTQPLQNFGVMSFYSPEKEKKSAWAAHWIDRGLAAYEAALRETAGEFSVGDSLTLADICLVPQCYNAERFAVPFREKYPIIGRIHEKVAATEAYRVSEPGRYE